MLSEMPPRKAAPPPAPAEIPAERLCDAVSDLAQHVHVLIDVLDDIREDLSWITRNGVPTRSIEHTRVLRMARDPLAPDAHDHLELRTYTLEPRGSTEISPKIFDELVSEIAEAVTVVGQEQLNMFLMALDDARAKLMAAIKDPAAKPAEAKPVAIPQPTPSAPIPAAERGRLF